MQAPRTSFSPIDSLAQQNEGEPIWERERQREAWLTVMLQARFHHEECSISIDRLELDIKNMARIGYASDHCEVGFMTYAVICWYSIELRADKSIDEFELWTRFACGQLYPLFCGIKLIPVEDVPEGVLWPSREIQPRHRMKTPEVKEYV